MWEDFHEAIAHTDHRLMGRKLRPFAPWHRLWLNIIESPLSLGGEIGHADLEIASRICAADYHTVPKVVRKGRWLAHKCRQAAMLWKMVRYPVPAQLAAWQAYVTDYCPELRFKKAGADTGAKFETLPSDLCLVATYRVLSHCTKEEAWMTPVGEAQWWIAAMRHGMGEDSGILPGQDRAMLDQGDIPTRAQIYAQLEAAGRKIDGSGL